MPSPKSIVKRLVTGAVFEARKAAATVVGSTPTVGRYMVLTPLAS